MTTDFEPMPGDAKHEPSAESTADVLAVLYERVLRVDPSDPASEQRDRFYLSKGHGPHAYYRELSRRGFIDPAVLETFGAFASPLGHHPDRVRLAGVEISSGSLGHGLPLAVGAALALRARDNRHSRVIVLVGDAELDEGSNQEAIALAGRLGLGRLTAVVIDNASSTHGWPGGIASRFALEGWTTATIDGRDRTAIEGAFADDLRDVPHVIVARVEAMS